MLSVGADSALVERQLVAGDLCCPECEQRLSPWGYAATRFVRATTGRVGRIRPRRAICSAAAGCGRSHVLLPRFCLGRRVDVVGVIWAALLARAAGRGWRAITRAIRRPASTVRGWLGRFQARAESIRVAFAWVERRAAGGGDLDRLTPTGRALGDVVAQIGAAVAAVRRRLGGAVLTVSAAQMVAACSGGWLLATRTVRPAGWWINTSPHL